MNRNEKLAATAVQLAEAKMREIRPQLIDAVTRGAEGEDVAWITYLVETALAGVPQAVRSGWATVLDWDNETREIAREFYGDEEEEESSC